MADLTQRLTLAIATASNDDMSEPGTEKRARHIARIDAMIEARDALSTSPAPSLPTREEIARVVDPHTFEDWQRKYDFEMKLSGDVIEARKFADWSEKERINAALAKADRILALFAQPQEKKL